MKVGIIGCGAIAQRAHLPAFSSVEGIELYAVSDVDEATVKRSAKKFNVPKSFTDYKDMLKDQAVDLVSICVPSPLHGKLMVDCANAGKHIFVEKPLALNVKESLQALNAVKENNVKLCVVQNYRYFPQMLKLKSLINSGSIGKITSILGQANTLVPLGWTTGTWLYHKGGAIDDFGPHLIDATCWFAESKPVRVAAFGGDFLGNMDCINYVQILAEFENKAVTTSNISWMNSSMLSMDIHGTAGSVDLDMRFNHFTPYHGYYDPITETKSSLRKLLRTATGAASGKLFRGALAFYPQIIKEFMASIEGNGKIPVTGEEALRMVAISEAAKLSLEKKQVIEVKDLIV